MMRRRGDRETRRSGYVVEWRCEKVEKRRRGEEENWRCGWVWNIYQIQENKLKT